MREKEGYRDELANIREAFGVDTHTLTVDEVAQYMKLDRRTVTRLIKRPRNPLPAIDIGSRNRPIYSIPVTKFASWRCG